MSPSSTPSLSSRWTATGDDWSLAWSPRAPFLTGSAEVIAELEVELGRAASIRLTPTSVAVESTAREPAAVLAALARCGRSFTLTGSPPTFESIPDRVY
jgi:hypothetical protein